MSINKSDVKGWTPNACFKTLYKFNDRLHIFTSGLKMSLLSRNMWLR